MGKSVRVTGPLGSRGTLASNPRPAEGTGTPPLPPVVLFLPGLSALPFNTSVRIADIICADLTRGPGTYAVRSLDSPGPGQSLTDGRRIVAGDDQPLMDLYTVAYRDCLPKAAATEGKAGVWTLVRLVITQLLYFLQALLLLVDARKRAKSRKSRWQLVLGSGFVAVLLGAVAVTIVAILAALGVVTPAKVNGTFADAFAIGATGVTTWLLAKATPRIRDVSSRVQQMMMYAQSQQQSVQVTNCLGAAIDAVLEPAGTTRPVFILGYSMGSLVAIDYLCPRASQLDPLDDPRVTAIRGLITIGCPLDFVRLYLPQYTKNRQLRVPELPWTNIFIAADVMGSNMCDEGDDYVPEPHQLVGITGVRVDPDKPDAGEPDAVKPTKTIQFTDERLSWSSIVAPRGFLSHGSYWSVPGAGNCLNVVLSAVRADGAAHADQVGGAGPR